MPCQSKYLPFSPSRPQLFHISLEHLNMDLVHSKVSLAFVVRVLNTPRGSVALSLAPSLCYAMGILVLCFLILLILALPMWLTGLALDLLCHCRIAWPSQGCCPNLSPLIGPALSSLLRYCRTAPLLVRT